jgi:YCII-related domain
MGNYLFTYRVPRDYPAVGPEVAAAWQGFLDGLGPDLVDAGNPVFTRTGVGNCLEDTVLGGYSIVAADDLGAAAALAERCPYVQAGGGVEVGEITPLNAERIATSADDHARATQQQRG